MSPKFVLHGAHDRPRTHGEQQAHARSPTLLQSLIANNSAVDSLHEIALFQKADFMQIKPEI